MDLAQASVREVVSCSPVRAPSASKTGDTMGGLVGGGASEVGGTRGAVGQDDGSPMKGGDG